MDTSRDRAVNPEGGTSIRLRYSRQFQSGGQAHTIDAEVALPLGTSQERREQIIRELETGVEQLARQIGQRGARPIDEARAQTPARPAGAPIPLAANKTAELAGSPQQRTTGAAPVTRAPVSESMPVTPSTGGERTIRRADFINVIKKYWDMSPQEAMQRLKVKSLDGLNYREAFNSLKTMMDAEGRSIQTQPPQSRNPQTQSDTSRPIVEAPRQSGRNVHPQPDAHPPINQATSAPGTHAQGQAARREVTRSAPPTMPVASSAPEQAPEEESSREPRAGVDFAGSPKAPIPIQLGVVRDLPPRSAYFKEEDEEEDLELPEEDDFELPEAESITRAKPRLKLDELKETRGSGVASAERLNVLKNVMNGQIDEEQLQQLIQGVWGINTRKKLKNAQVEALISWAKEDYFADEAEELLSLLEEGEE